MRLKKQSVAIPLFVVFSFMLISWGSVGHYNISKNALLSFNQEMQPLNDWIDYIASHGSDADYRKSSDPGEGPRHYIDIDKYQEFLNNGAISQSMSEVIAQNGERFVYDAGVLPWTTIQTYDSLRECMIRKDWEKAKFFAADLGHYVADGHMPMHITKNYDGQLTGNKGIHSRYESTMINANIDKIIYSGENPQVIENISDYVFHYLYANYPYVDSIIAADNYAISISSNTSSTEYKDALWGKTQEITTTLFKNASHALAELIYTAWVEAEKSTETSIIRNTASNLNLLITPNPFRGNGAISFSITNQEYVSIEVRDFTGKTVAVLANNILTPNVYTINWDAQTLPAGIYMIDFRTPSLKKTQKIILLD